MRAVPPDPVHVRSICRDRTVAPVALPSAAPTPLQIRLATAGRADSIAAPAVDYAAAPRPCCGDVEGSIYNRDEG
jgi:hypothetical protein